MSPLNAAASPFVKAPWTNNTATVTPLFDEPSTGLVGSMISEEGCLYYVVAFSDLLYATPDSKNIRVWKNHTEFSGFKFGSGLVKAIIIFPRENLHDSWDKTMKVWIISDSKCLESVSAHDNTVNSVAVRFDRLIFTRFADGTVKVWRRKINTKNDTTKHMPIKVLLQQESIKTTLAASYAVAVVYCEPDPLFMPLIFKILALPLLQAHRFF